MTKNATSSKTPRKLKEIKKNRRKNENPLNNKELNFQKKPKEQKGYNEK